MKHKWQRNIVLPEREVIDEKTGKKRIIPPLIWFPKCSVCGCQVTEVGKNLIYRATADLPWGYDEPDCKAQEAARTEGAQASEGT